LSRCLASSSTTRTESSASGSGSSSSKGEEVDDSKRPLYQNSKAALRPRANARSPLYASGTLLKSLPRSQRNESKGSSSVTPEIDERTADASYVAALRSPAARSDDKLRQLYSQLNKTTRNSRNDAIHCVQVCKLIKQHLEQISPEGAAITPPIYVYEVLLKRLAIAGAYDLCLEVITEMEDTGFSIGISELNFLVGAAVQNGEEVLIEEALSKIASLDGVSEASAQSTSSHQFTILSESMTRNWNSTTYQHLLKRCALSHNPEFALLLIGSASYRQKKDGDGLSFLSDVLTHTTVVDIIMTICHAREARLAVELGQWFHNGVAARKLAVQSWMTILRCCAEQAYLPGIKISWHHAVDQGLLTPDDGLVINVINAAAREGDVEFVERIQSYHRIRLAQANLSLHEWHLTLLFEAHCVNGDYGRAIQSIVDTGRLTHTNYTTNSLIPLKTRAQKSTQELDKAYEAFLEVGRDLSPNGGVSTVVLNSLMQAANRLEKSAMVFKLYRSRKLVRNESSPIDAELPPLPIMLTKERDEVDELKRTNVVAEDSTSTAPGERTDRWTPGSAIEIPAETDIYKHGLQADIETFNEALYAAVQIQNHLVGQIFLRHMNAAKIQANERTYELAIRLELTNKDYQDAFRLLEECKKRGMVPNRWTYMYIGKRCLHENDPRWIMISKEMMENQYSLGGQLTYAMLEGGLITAEEARGYSTKDDRPRYERPGTGYGPMQDDYSSR
jgi:hypothetical protein